MAIRHFHTDRETNEVTETSSHVGRVVHIWSDSSVRIMSDVWATITYAKVYEPNGPEGYGSDRVIENIEKGWSKPAGMFRTIIIGNSEMYSQKDYVKAEIDADEDTREIFAGHQLGLDLHRKLDDYNAREFRAQESRRSVRHDSVVRVTKGRKVPQGTEGVVFWIGNSGYGEKVGLGLPCEDGSFEFTEKAGRYGKVFKSYKNVAWTALSNVQVIDKLGGRVL